MSRRWGRAALCAVWSIVLVSVLDGPATADAPTDGYTAWATHDQRGNDIAPLGSPSLTPEAGAVTDSGAVTEVQIGADQGDREWRLTLRGDVDHPLQAGRTYVSTDDNPFSTSTNPMSASLFVEGNCTLLVGSFTIDELALDGEALGRFSGTYSFHCLGDKGTVTGSVAYHASDPPPAAPEPPGGMLTGAVGGLRADFALGEYTLHWTDPDEDDWVDTIVCATPGLKPYATPDPWCLEHGATTSGEDWGEYTAVRGYAVGVWPRYRDGTLGRRSTITLRGSIVTLSSDPSSSGAVTGLRLHGTVQDGPSHAPMPGRTVDVFASRPRPNYSDAVEGGRNEDVLVAVLRTDQNGEFTRNFPLRPGWSYQARFDGNGVRIGNLSHPLVPADGSSAIDLDAVQPGAARSRIVRLRAKDLSVHRGDRVVFQRLKKGRWRKVVVRAVGSSGVVVSRARISRKSAAAFRAVLYPSGGAAARASIPVRVPRR